MNLAVMYDALFDLHLAACGSTEASNFTALVIVFSSVKRSVIVRDLRLRNHQMVAIAWRSVCSEQ